MNIATLSEPLFRAKGWMKFIGVLMIIYGVLTALTIVGIVIAWLPIWIGVLLFQSAGLVERAHGQNDENAMIASLAKLKTYFTITGILALIGICLAVLGMILSFSGVLLLQQQLGTGSAPVL